MNRACLIWSVCGPLLIFSRLVAAEPTFSGDVQPILQRHCIKCHGGKTRKGSLDLRSLPSILRGGESGETLLVARKPAQSHLWKLVSRGEMPPKGSSQLSPTEKQTLKRWIKSGTFQSRRPARSKSAELAKQVQFTLEVKCWYCHGEREQKGGLDLRTRKAMLRGGKSGPAIRPGDPAASLVVQKIKQNLMPPHLLRYKLSIKPINNAEMGRISEWIRQGASEFPRPPKPVQDDGRLVSQSDRQWWSFRSPKKASLPPLQLGARNAIDTFVQQRLAQQRLRLSPPAGRRTWIRRLYFDLWGLPPSPAAVASFVNDQRPNAYEALVDRLLASPRFGERWGQHWLDAAGYADSEGSAAADIIYSLMYQYRDYVIRSHNQDRPYDEFLVQQLAGDELHDYASLPRLTQRMRDNLVATGYLRMCIDPTTSPETNFRIDRHQVLADTVEIVTSSLLGLTMRCARCHTHKYDPLPQRDYYRFTAIFAAAYTPHRWIKPRDRYVWLVSDREQREIRDFNASLQIKINQPLHQRNVLTYRARVKQLQAHLAKIPAGEVASVKKAIAKPYGKPSALEMKLITRMLKRLGLSDGKIRSLDPHFRRQEAKLTGQIKELQKQKKDVPRAHGLTDVSARPLPFYLARRGVWSDRGRRVLPNVPAVLRDRENNYTVRKPKSPTTGYRLALARWITSNKHPLTARVFVNRVWRHYFGRGIVESVGDFGRTGTKPTHPELLDWLAVEFMESGWGIKKLHRMIVTSAVYRQSSATHAWGRRVDPENRLLWRMPLRRMDAESIRDSLLAVSQQLSLEMYGPGRGVTKRGDDQFVSTDKALTRSIYVLHRRSTPLTMLATFDFPRMTTNCVQRQTSNVVSQALLLANGELTERAARQIAQRVLTTAQPIRHAYQAILRRAPEVHELKLTRQFFDQQSQRYQGEQKLKKQGGKRKGQEGRLLALTDLCLVLLNSAEFLYVD